jgi:hypothetical protein
MIAAAFDKHLTEWVGLVLFVVVVAGMLASAWRCFTAPEPSQADRDVDVLARRRS